MQSAWQWFFSLRDVQENRRKKAVFRGRQRIQRNLRKSKKARLRRPRTRLLMRKQQILRKPEKPGKLRRPRVRLLMQKHQILQKPEKLGTRLLMQKQQMQVHLRQRPFRKRPVQDPRWFIFLQTSPRKVS